MKVCSSCGKEGEDSFVACPFCGTKYEEGPANEDTAKVAEEPKAEAQTAAAAEEETAAPVAEEAEENAAPAEEVSFLAKKAFGKKAEKFEKKNHFIVNGVVALFSLLLFVMTFFAGVNIAPMMGSAGGFYSGSGYDSEEEAFEDLYGEADGLNQGTVDLIAGAFGFIETDKSKMAKYISDVSEKFAAEIQKAYKKYEKDFQELSKIKDEEKLEKEYEALIKKVLNEAARKSGYNVVKINYYTARLGAVDKTSRIHAFAGAVVAVITGALLLATLISAFVFAILAAVALAKRKKVTKPFRALTLPLAFLLMAFAVCSLNPIAAINGVAIACVVISLIGVLLLCAVKRLILDNAENFTVKSLIRGGVSLLCTVLAFFLLCGTLYTVKLGKFTVHASMGITVRELLRGATTGSNHIFAYGKQIGDMAFMTIAYGLITWLCAIGMTVKCVIAAWHDLYTGKDEQENRKGKKTSSIGFTIAALVLGVISLVLTFITLSKSKPSVGLSVIFAFIFLVGDAVVKGVLAAPKKAEEEEE